MDKKKIDFKTLVDMFRQANPHARIEVGGYKGKYKITVITEGEDFHLPESFTFKGNGLIPVTPRTETLEETPSRKLFEVNTIAYDFDVDYVVEHIDKVKEREYAHTHPFLLENGGMINIGQGNPDIVYGETRIRTATPSEIREIRDSVTSEEASTVTYFMRTALWLLITAASIYLNKDAMLAVQNPTELLTSWPEFIQFAMSLGPITLVSVVGTIISAKGFSRHLTKFSNLFASLAGIERDNHVHIPTETISERILIALNRMGYDINEFIKERRRMSENPSTTEINIPQEQNPIQDGNGIGGLK